MMPLNWNEENAALQEALIQNATAVISKMTIGGFTEVANRQAVYFTVWKGSSPARFFRVKIGTTFPEDVFQEGCFDCSLEKAERIKQFGLDSSYEKRDEKAKKYGGAVRLIINGVVWIFSISGLREPEEQSAGLLIPHLLVPSQVNLEIPQVRKIIDISSRFESRTPQLFEDVRLQLTGS